MPKEIYFQVWYFDKLYQILEYKIQIKVECEGHDCIITIKDDGKGIPDRVKEKILEKGFQAGENAVTGLGTYLVKHILESHGGEIEIKDSELGGARFDINLQRTE